jgi:hypothetical protein
MRADVVTYNILKNDVDVLAITSKVFPGVVPLNISPNLAITYNVITTNPVQSQTIETNTDMVQMQVSVFATSYNDVQNLADVVVAAMNGKSGLFTIAGNDFKYKNIRLTGRNDLGFDDDSQVYMVALDFFIQMFI